MEANKTSSKGKEPAATPTTAPRLSFACELEFMVAELIEENGPDPDKAFSHLLPPVYPWMSTESRLREILELNGIPVQPDDPVDRCAPGMGWRISRDPSLTEMNSDYFWSAVEIQGPATYTFSAAFDMYILVTTLIKRNFRCRVNESAGLHVHISGGYERLDARTIRNFSALWWSCEPILTFLHPKERAFGGFAASSRRVRDSRLSCNKGAEDVRMLLAKQTIPVALRVQYQGRERDLGESANVPQIFNNALGWFNGPTGGDGKDWSGKGTRPFQRNRYDGDGQLVTDDLLMNPGRLSLRTRSPPTIPSRPKVEKNGQETLRLREKALYEGKGAEQSSADPTKTVETWLKTTRELLFPRLTERTSNYRPVETEKEGLSRERAARIPSGGLGVRKPWRMDPWSGIAELLACDAGSHQCAELLTNDMNFRGFNLNTTHYTSREIQYSVRLPDSELSEEGRKARKKRTNEFPDEIGAGLTTLEFREAAGSLDGVWIATWARILVGLVDFARDADPAELMRVIGRCAEASEEENGDQPAGFDVVDLLQATGLWAEARYVEGRLARGNEAFFECALSKPDWSFPNSPDGGDRLDLDNGSSSGRSSGMTSLLRRAEEAVKEVNEERADWLNAKSPTSKDLERETRDQDD